MSVIGNMPRACNQRAVGTVGSVTCAKPIKQCAIQEIADGDYDARENDASGCGDVIFVMYGNSDSVYSRANMFGNYGNSRCIE